MKIYSLMDIFFLIEKLYEYLKGKISFDENGLPIFIPQMFLNEWPEIVIPFSQRNNWRVKNRNKTVLCFFDNDSHLYPRIANVIEEIDEYKDYLGIIGLDITITEDMDQEWQEFIFLLNQLFLAVLAVNNIKIIVNTRSASLDAKKIFNNIPSDVMNASGFLGCDKTEDKNDFSYLSKILTLLPDKLIIYGKHDIAVETQLDTMGINYRVYTDFHRLCKEVRHGR